MFRIFRIFPICGIGKERKKREKRKGKKMKRQEGEFEKQSRVLPNNILIYLKDMQGDMMHEVMTMRKYNNRQT